MMTISSSHPKHARSAPSHETDCEAVKTDKSLGPSKAERSLPVLYSAAPNSAWISPPLCALCTGYFTEV